MKNQIFVTITFKRVSKIFCFVVFGNKIPKIELDNAARSLGCLDGQTYSYSGRYF